MNLKHMVYDSRCVFIAAKLMNIEFNCAIFRKLRGQKKNKISFFGSVFDAEKYRSQNFSEIRTFRIF